MPDLTFEQSDHGKTIEVPLNARCTINLKENATTGYKWTQPVFDEHCLTWESEGFTLPGDAGAGGGGIRRFVFFAKAEGKTSIHLEYRRPWEKNALPVSAFDLLVVIKE
jgi:predicted secreted protein